MGRIAIIIGLIVLGAGLVWQISRPDHKIIVSDATISRMMDGTIMASATLTNDGAPDVLLSARSKGFQHVHFMGAKGALVVPGGASPSLSGDGAHIMMMGGGELDVGELVPVELVFENAGNVTTRAKIVDAMMDHSNMMGIEAPNVSLSLRLEGVPGRDGATGVVEVEGLTFVSHPGGTPHKDGEGHAHVYLNGLKLQRLFASRFDTGQLAPGDYTLRVSVNSNDHRPFMKAGKPIAHEIAFTVN